MNLGRAFVWLVLADISCALAVTVFGLTRVLLVFANVLTLVWLVGGLYGFVLLVRAIRAKVGRPTTPPRPDERVP